MRSTTYQQSTIKWLAFIGIILVTLNLRTAITPLSPIYNRIGESFPITTISQSILGMLPPISLSMFGWIAPRLASKIGFEKTLLLAMIMIFIGLVSRSVSSSVLMFSLFFFISLMGIGISNVLLPPVIKVYFPTQIGLLTSIYTALVSVSASIPALLVIPMTESYGWRVSTAIWAILAIMAAVPWAMLLKNNPTIPGNTKVRQLPAWHWSTSWALMVIFGFYNFILFAVISWLPKILTSISQTPPSEVGKMLSVLTAVGFIPALFIPYLVTRIKHPYFLILTFAICTIAGCLGLIFLPEAVLVWVISIGLGMAQVPICLTLINLRSRTPAGASALSGFVQGVGFLFGALGPLVIGAAYNLTGTWIVALWLLVGTAVISALAGLVVVKPGSLEDHLGPKEVKTVSQS